MQTVAVLSCIASISSGAAGSHAASGAGAAGGAVGGGAVAASRRLLLPAEYASAYARCRRVYADLLMRWGLLLPLAELSKFGADEQVRSPTTLHDLPRPPTISHDLPRSPMMS